jgi:hypothetical protein
MAKFAKISACYENVAKRPFTFKIAKDFNMV